MGKFADNVAPAAKLVVSTLPKVTINGVVCYVPPTDFDNQLQFNSSIARASEFLNVNAKTDVSLSMAFLVAAQILIGESLVDADGNPIISDKQDMKAFLDILYKDKKLWEELGKHSGWDERVETLKANPKPLQSPTNEEVQENALGNSNTPLVNE